MGVSVLWAAALVAISAQGPAAAGVAPRFEVASVRPSEGTTTGWSYFAKGDRFTITNLTLKRIIALAHGIPLQLEQFRIAGGTNTLLSRRFDIQAKIPEGVATDRVVPMLKSLLVERFRLQAVRQLRQGPVYSLVVARGRTLGPELRPSKHNCNQYKAAWLESNTPASEVVRPRDAKNRPLCVTRPEDERPPPASVQLRDAGTISDLIASIQGFLDRPVLDATQLSGNFEWQLTSSPFPPRPRTPGNNSNVPEVPSMSVAIREQLGLQLEPRTGPIEVLFIESVGMPEQN
ncbi:MAG: TIGR03435 family protein [Vicinamibacterales bacterium]